MDGLRNLDLLSVGIAIAGIGILGFIVFFNNRRSITNKTVLFFSISAILWSIFNYSYQQPDSPDTIFLLLRLHAFFAVWYVFFIFQLFYVFPRENIKFLKGYKFFLLPLVGFVSILTLTPFVFKEITKFSLDGRIAGVANGPGIFLFGATVVGLIISGPIMFIRRRRKATTTEKKQFSFVLVGALITFSLHIIFNFIFPAFLNNPRFIQLGAVFIFPFIVLTSYAIFKHHLLNVKVIATEILTFVLAVAMLFEVILSKDPATLALRSGVFALVLGLGILLIRSVLKEVEQREQLQVLNVKLNKANTELESLSRFKTQLLSLASHQVKSPLAAIKGFATLLIEGSYGVVGDKVKETLGKIKRASDNLINLVNTLLDLRKVEEGKMEYTFAKIGIRELVGSIVAELEPLAKAKNLKFTFAPGPEFMVSADSSKLRQVIQNLVDNAIKYTPSGFVHVKIKDLGDSIAISVIDSGVGVPKELLPHLFEEFIRDERVKKDILGTGLGLYIARKIVEAHNGTIGAESEGPGRGSKFFVKLKKL